MTALEALGLLVLRECGNEAGFAPLKGTRKGWFGRVLPFSISCEKSKAVVDTTWANVLAENFLNQTSEFGSPSDHS